jgi:hypothetical protein
MNALLLLSTALLAAPAVNAEPFDPTARYVTPGQDEPGYRAWYIASPVHPIRVTGFHHYLTLHDAAWVLPTWQVVRTASDWHRCGHSAFEVPPTSEWPNIVQTLRLVRDEVIPVVGPVEAVSAYRNPDLNACAGGSPASAHLGFFALDLVPLTPIEREELVRTLCEVHDRRGKAYGAGLGFYSFLRFHVDARGFRRWVPAGEGLPCEPIEAEPQAPIAEPGVR